MVIAVNSTIFIKVHETKHEEVREVLKGIDACNERLKIIGVTVIVYVGR